MATVTEWEKYTLAIEALLSQCMAMRRAKAERANASNTADHQQRQWHATQAWREVEDSVKFLEHVLTTLEGGYSDALSVISRRRHMQYDELIPRICGMHSLLPPMRTVQLGDGDNDDTDTHVNNTLNVLDAEWVQRLAGRGYTAFPIESSRDFHRALRRHASAPTATDGDQDNTDGVVSSSSSSGQRPAPY